MKQITNDAPERIISGSFIPADPEYEGPEIAYQVDFIKIPVNYLLFPDGFIQLLISENGVSFRGNLYKAIPEIDESFLSWYLS